MKRLYRIYLISLFILPFQIYAKNLEDNYKIINLSDDFISLYQSSKNMPIEKRNKLFAEKLSLKFDAFYNDKSFVEAIEDFSEIENKYVVKEQSFLKNLSGSMESFLATFPDFETETPIYVLHSLGNFNGATRKLNGKDYLMFGIDLMAKYHNWVNETPFFHHELFHVYHEPEFQCDEELWCSIWTEGLATYISHELNNTATNDELMLNIPDNMVEDINSNLYKSLIDLKVKFYSKEPNVYSAFFNFQNDETNLPYRRGYYLGYILAKEVGKNYSLQELAKMKKENVEFLLLKELDILIQSQG